MKIYLATDHAGFQLKEIVKEELLGQDYEVEDCGAVSFNKYDDYPDFVSVAAKQISKFPFDRAIIFGGNGQAEAFLANKYPFVKAVVFYGTKTPIAPVDVHSRISEDPYEMIRLVREHDNANILSLGARFVSEEEALEAVRLFLATPFPEDERHMRRLKQVEEIEKTLYESHS